MHCRIAAVALGLIALTACAGDRVTNVRTPPDPAMVVMHTTLQWTGAAGEQLQVTAPDLLVPQAFVPRGDGGGGERQQPRPPIHMAPSLQGGYTYTDSTGTAWSMAVLLPTNAAPEFYLSLSNDTARFAYAATWTAIGDSGYALTRLQDSIFLDTLSGVVIQTFTSHMNVVPVNASVPVWSRSWWFAQRANAPAWLGNLFLPDAAQAQTPQLPPWVTYCAPQLFAVGGSLLLTGAGIGTVLASGLPGTLYVTLGQEALGALGTVLGVTGAWFLPTTLTNLGRCINPSGGAGRVDSTGTGRPRPT